MPQLKSGNDIENWLSELRYLIFDMHNVFHEDLLFCLSFYGPSVLNLSGNNIKNGWSLLENPIFDMHNIFSIKFLSFSFSLHQHQKRIKRPLKLQYLLCMTYCMKMCLILPSNTNYTFKLNIILLIPKLKQWPWNIHSRYVIFHNCASNSSKISIIQFTSKRDNVHRTITCLRSGGRRTKNFHQTNEYVYEETSPKMISTPFTGKTWSYGKNCHRIFVSIMTCVQDHCGWRYRGIWPPPPPFVELCREVGKFRY